MDRGLVVFDDRGVHQGLLREAAEHASGADAPLLLLVLVDEAAVEEDVETLSSIGRVERTHYDAETVLSAVATDLADAARDVMDDYDIAFDSKATANDAEANAVISTAAEHDCDHVFLIGRRRSPTRKAMFGDLAQQVILNFEGYVTLAAQ